MTRWRWKIDGVENDDDDDDYGHNGGDGEDDKVSFIAASRSITVRHLLMNALRSLWMNVTPHACRIVSLPALPRPAPHARDQEEEERGRWKTTDLTDMQECSHRTS
eukprot:768006-Hanusia_phi.AAC.2